MQKNKHKHATLREESRVSVFECSCILDYIASPERSRKHNTNTRATLREESGVCVSFLLHLLIVVVSPVSREVCLWLILSLTSFSVSQTSPLYIQSFISFR